MNIICVIFKQLINYKCITWIGLGIINNWGKISQTFFLPYQFLIVALSYTDSKQPFQSSLHTVPLISVLPLSPTNVFSYKKYFKCTLCSCLKDDCCLLASKIAITCMQRDQYHPVPIHRTPNASKRMTDWQMLYGALKVPGINRFSVNPASPICNLCQITPSL